MSSGADVSGGRSMLPVGQRRQVELAESLRAAVALAGAGRLAYGVVAGAALDVVESQVMPAPAYRLDQLRMGDLQRGPPGFQLQFPQLLLVTNLSGASATESREPRTEVGCDPLGTEGADEGHQAPPAVVQERPEAAHA